jgi:hypothetical protein
MGRRKSFNKTEESIFTLSSLFVLSEQAFESLTGNENILLSDFDKENYSFNDLANDTIHEALIYQILLKACSFLEEWNNVFGINTEEKDKEKIIMIKKIVKPAYKCISTWKDLKDFRNHYIAHNHRNREGKNIYLNFRSYDSPKDVHDLYLLIYCLYSMFNAMKFFFKKEYERISFEIMPSLKTKERKPRSKKFIKGKIKEIDIYVTDILMRYDIVSRFLNEGDAMNFSLHIQKKKAGSIPGIVHFQTFGS